MTGEETLHLFWLMLSYLLPTLKLFGFTLLYAIPLGIILLSAFAAYFGFRKSALR